VLVSLETLVPQDNIYRRLDRTLDLSIVREWVKACYADGGRPSIDPVVFFRLQLVLYLEGLRSERQLMMSTTDSDASTMRSSDGVLQLGYQDIYVADGSRARIILNVLATPGDVMENQVMLDLLWRTCFRWKVRPDQVAADTTYGTIENILPIEDAGIAMYTPLPDWDSRMPYFVPSLFTYDPETDIYQRPDGETLRRDHVKYTEGKIVYRTERGVCAACALRSQCTTSKEGRSVQRNIDEDYLDRVRAHHKTEAYAKAMRKRSLWTEPLFAEAKLWHGMRRFRLRRLWRVNIEPLMVATAQNLKRLLTWRARRYPPASGMAVPAPYMVTNPPFIGRIIAWIVGAAPRRRGRGLVPWPAAAL
jgi:hypothetical protein